MSGRRTACQRKCCWTPYGVCAKKGICACHVADFAAMRNASAVSARVGISIAEVARRRGLRKG
jgi:hypothetical protein